MEKWKDIKGYEGLYKISNKGRVLSNKKNKILKNGTGTKGYELTFLYKDGKRKTLKIHKLVANAFIENTLNKEQVNHIDGNKKNNNVENLEWCSNLENMQHAYRIGLNRGRGGIESPHCREIIQYDMNLNKIAEWKSIKMAGESLNIKPYNIQFCCSGRLKSISGFIFRYKENI